MIFPLTIDCVGNGDRPRSEYRSVVYYHNNSPRYMETFRLSLPPDTFNVCHLYFEFRLGTKEKKEKPAFAVGFFKPTKLDGTVVDDAKHTVALLRPTKLENEAWYLKQITQDPKVVRKGEQLIISTFLVSTQLTKNSASLLLVFLFLSIFHCKSNSILY